jgi:hypothetical protein
MKYLCLVYNEEKNLEAMSSEEFKDFVDEHLACEEEFRRNGQLIAAEGLESVRSASTVRIRGGRMTVTDGPFAETKEQLGGFYLIEARDLNEALQAAAKIPPARMGSIEVRPIRHLEWSDGTARRTE